MELLITMDALVRASARRITAVIPYFGYSRQDRKTDGRTPISAKLVANLITTAGADRVVTVDLHAAQIQGFFDKPTDNLFAQPEMADDILKKYGSQDLMVISPDVGGVVRARALAKRLNTDLAIVDKRREKAGESEVMNIIGDVEGRKCILIDDMTDSGGTLINAADALLKKGAKEVAAYVTHGVLSNGAAANIDKSQLKELVITDTIQAPEAGRRRRRRSAPSPSPPSSAKPSAASRTTSRSRRCSTKGKAAARLLPPLRRGRRCRTSACPARTELGRPAPLRIAGASSVI